MKPDDAKKLADRALTELADALKQGKSQALTDYLAMLARFHRYSFGNVLLILFQRPTATHVAGFTTWKQLGRFVKAGEKGIVILAPMILRTKDEESAEDTKRKPILRFRAVYVFDVSQTDGETLPAPAQVAGDPAQHLASLKSFVTGKGITIDSTDLPPGALGVSRGGSIGIQLGLTPAEEFAVLSHELAHELLHQNGNRPASKTVRETEAEAVAFVVSHAIGLTATAAAKDYIELYQGTTETLADSLGAIQRVSAEILASITADKAAHAA